MGESIHWQSLIPFLDNHAYTIMIMMFLDYAIVIGILFVGTRNMKLKPGKTQNLVEWAVKYITDYADSIIGKEAPRFYWLLIMLFFYILVGNFMGLIPGLMSPTSILPVTLALALIVFFYEWFSGLVKKGPVKFFAHYLGPDNIPMPIRVVLFFIEFISDILRPVSLSFRLFGNIMAKETLLGVLVLLVVLMIPALKATTGADFSALLAKSGTAEWFLASFAFVLRPLIILLGVLVSILQAGVFTLLASVYIAGAVEAHGHGEENEAH